MKADQSGGRFPFPLVPLGRELLISPTLGSVSWNDLVNQASARPSGKYSGGEMRKCAQNELNLCAVSLLDSVWSIS